MMQSMTAFSRVQSQTEDAVLLWEMRAVNHRYLDLSFRLPEQFRSLEGLLRGIMRGKISRGKVECFLKLNDHFQSMDSLEVNEALIKSLLKVGKNLATSYHLADDVRLSHVLAWPGVIIAKSPNYEMLESEILELFKKGLEALLVSKQNEGAVLADNLKKWLQLMTVELESIKQNAASFSQLAHAKLLKRLDELKTPITDVRLAEEVALLMTRLDITEEIERLDAHIGDVGMTLESAEPAGRRLDFLMQELNREVNTICSKSDSLSLSSHALQMKVLIERMREQIQNLE